MRCFEQSPPFNLKILADTPRTLPFRIAFDLDGVLADMESGLARQAERLFGEAASPPESAQTTKLPGGAELRSRVQMTSTQQQRLWKHVRALENFWETLDELEPGVIARLSATADQRRWEIIFLTTRPECAGPTAQVQSQRWLEAKGFRLPSVFVVHGSRGRIAASLALDVVVDDRPENCLDVAVDSTARAILVWRNQERQLPVAARRFGIEIVKTMGECLDIVTQMDPNTQREQPGVMDRFMRFLHLKDPARA